MGLSIIWLDILHHRAPLSGHPRRIKYSLRTFLFLLCKSWLNSDFRVVLYFRIYSYFYSRARFLSILFYFHVKSRYCCDISPMAKIGAGFRLVHAFNIVIGPNVEIGRFCTLFNGVSLGSSRPDLHGYRMPKIGSNVILGTGAKCLGDFSIPSRLLVPANCLVTRSTFRECSSRFVSLKDSLGHFKLWLA